MHMQLHPVAFQCGTSKGSKLNWATLKKDAHAIHMAFRKFSYYLEGTKTILRSDHAPLQKFLVGKTLNNTVNNWDIELSSFKIFFQHIKEKHNVMADALSRLKIKGLYETQDPEPNRVEFRHTILESLPKVNVNQINVTDSVTLPMPIRGCQATDMTEHQINDKFCSQVTQNINLPKYKDYKEDNGLLY